ncbi:MAG TPA: hypothetical protein VKA50_03045 [Gammaproteobacteria bacterium]|nr:hypothetical protein [Gammaproteobacteria bacterium]
MSDKFDDSALWRLLQPGAVGIISARCCSADAVLQEQDLRDRLDTAMQRTGRQDDVTVETITDAQRGLMFLGPRLDQRQRSLVGRLLGLFQEYGLGLFPVLIVNGEVASHSEVPPAEAIETWLRDDPSVDGQGASVAGNSMKSDDIRETLNGLETDGCCSPGTSVQTEPEEYPLPDRFRGSSSV